MKTEILKPTKKNLKLAADEIKSGGLVAFATETVYGLGGNAFSENSAKKIFEAKGRPSDNPLIVHLAKKSDIKKIGYLTKAALKAVKSFMPGALTIIIKKKEIIPYAVTGGLDTVAIRIPKSKTARKFINKCGLPIAAPSANTSTKPSPTTADHVLSDLNGKIRYILDGGSCEIGLESTIIDFCEGKIRLLRTGGIAIEELEKKLGKIEVYALNSSEKPLSPGMKYRHYAPKARLVLFNNGDISSLESAFFKAESEGVKVRAITITKSEKIERLALHFDSAEEYANKLFFSLREADSMMCDLILCEKAADFGIGKSINNRLTKAAGGN